MFLVAIAEGADPLPPRPSSPISIVLLIEVCKPQSAMPVGRQCLYHTLSLFVMLTYYGVILHQVFVQADDRTDNNGERLYAFQLDPVTIKTTIQINDGFDPNTYRTDFSIALDSHLDEWFRKSLPTTNDTITIDGSSSVLGSDSFSNILLLSQYEFQGYSNQSLSSSSTVVIGHFNETAWFLLKYNNESIPHDDSSDVILNITLRQSLLNPAFHELINELRKQPTLSTLVDIEIYINDVFLIGGRLPSTNVSSSVDQGGNHHATANPTTTTSTLKPQDSSNSSIFMNTTASLSTVAFGGNSSISSTSTPPEYNNGTSNPSTLITQQVHTEKKGGLPIFLIIVISCLSALVVVFVVVKRRRNFAYIVSSSYRDGDQIDSEMNIGSYGRRRNRNGNKNMEDVQEIVFDDFVGVNRTKSSLSAETDGVWKVHTNHDLFGQDDPVYSDSQVDHIGNIHALQEIVFEESDDMDKGSNYSDHDHVPHSPTSGKWDYVNNKWVKQTGYDA